MIKLIALGSARRLTRTSDIVGDPEPLNPLERYQQG
jgi:hypothetical protein